MMTYLKKHYSMTVSLSRRRSTLAAVLGCGVILLVATPSIPAVVIPPPGLQSGDQYQLLFVTRDMRNATSTNIADYDAFVNAQAALGTTLPTGVSWSALASTSTVAAKNHVPTTSNIPIYNTSGQRLYDNMYKLWNYSPLNMPAYDQFGNWCNRYVWTGSNSTGTIYTGRALGDPETCYGPSATTSWTWFGAPGYYTSNSTAYSIYAFSSVITVPEPSTLVIFGVGAISLLGRAWRRKRA